MSAPSTSNLPAEFPATMTLRLSVSAYQAFQRCEAKYYYGYFKGLRKQVRDVAPQRGIILHSYMEAYYGKLKDGAEPQLAHKLAKEAMRSKHEEGVAASLAFAIAIEDEELQVAYANLLASCDRITDRYFRTRGLDDASRYVVLLVEERLPVQLIPGVLSFSIIDLVLKERETGLQWLVEHKSTGNVPDNSVRMRDFQTLLYATMLERKRGVKVDGVLWNYLRTKEPTVPSQLKTPLKGTKDIFPLSRDKQIDTTWEVYRQAIIDAGQDPVMYADVEERLRDREHTVFFPRFEQIITASPRVLLRDYAQTGLRMRAAVAQWEQGVEPVRSINRDCSWCDFARLCEAVWTDGDTEELIELYYEKKGAKKKNGSSSSPTGVGASVAAEDPADTFALWGTG